MVNHSIKKKHQQFALILIAIVLIVGTAFSVWYFSEKKAVESTQKVTVPAASQRDGNVKGVVIGN